MKLNLFKNPEGYIIYPNGTIWSNKTGRYLKPQKCSNGYLFVALRRNGKTIQCRIHRLVAIEHIPNPENKPEVNHKDGDKTNNQVYNLEWVTASENRKHSFDNGLCPPPPTMEGKFGYDHNRSIEVHVFDFETRKHITNYGSMSEAGRELGLCVSTISKAIKAGSKCRNQYLLTI
jgi:hypothetical protein